MADSITQAADILMGVRQGGPQVPNLGAAAPRMEAEVWAIQREVLRRLGGRIGGYKCAAPPGKPTSAAILDAAGIRPAPTTWKVGPGGRSASRPRSPSASAATCRRAPPPTPRRR